MTLMWGYEPSKCDDDFCIRDCDLCAKADEPAGKENKMYYIVRLSYIDFKFDDGPQAITFAELAKNKAIEPLDVKIKIIHDDEAED